MSTDVDMPISLDEYAQRARNAGETLAQASVALSRLDPGAGGFGVSAPGRLGELGRALYEQWTGALAAREREASAHGARYADLAQALRLIAADLRAVDRDAAGRSRVVDEGVAGRSLPEEP